MGSQSQLFLPNTAQGSAPSSIVDLLTTEKPTPIWALVDSYYGFNGNNRKTKEQVRIVRQFNSAWMDWPEQVVPKKTVVVLPRLGLPFTPIANCTPVTVNRGEGPVQVLKRYSKSRYAKELSAVDADRLVPLLEGTNSIYRNELEPGWTLYMPDDAIRARLGLGFPFSPAPQTSPFDFSATISTSSAPLAWMKTPSYTIPKDVVLDATTQILDKEGRRLIQDYFTSNRMTLVAKQSNGKTILTVKGSNRSLIQGLGIKGTRYVVGSEKHLEAMRTFSRETGLIISGESSVLRGALVGTLKGSAKALPMGTLLSVGVDAAIYVANGQPEKLATQEFLIDAGNNAIDGVIAMGAGTLASAATMAAACALGCSVVPGLGTLIGFIVGLGVGVLMNCLDVKWLG